ncbi:MAG: hypothetical protein ACTSVA_03355 [Candidatus Njordarchaeales archaeon]
MLIIKAFSSEWCDLESFIGNYKVIHRNIEEIGCIKGDMGEKIIINKDLEECLKKYNADIAILFECEADHPQAALIFLKERKIIYYLHEKYLRKK